MHRGQKLKEIVIGIIEVADSQSPNRHETVEHLDVLQVTAVVVKSILEVLAGDNPEIGISAYRAEFLAQLDPILDGQFPRVYCPKLQTGNT